MKNLWKMGEEDVKDEMDTSPETSKELKVNILH